MSKPFDYSKWDNIELSDDEDDVHPNIDRESWFRLKHRSRVEREDKEEVDKKRIDEEMKAADLRISEINRIIASLDKAGGGDGDSDDELEDKEGLEAELAELRAANRLRQDKLDEYEKNKKWNVDNMCHVVEERTIINKKTESKFSESGYALPDSEPGTDAPKAESGAAKDEEEEDATTATVGDSAPTTKMDALKVGGDTEAKKNAAPPQKEKKEVTKTGPTQNVEAKKEEKKVVGPDREKIAMLSYHEFTEKYADICEEFMTIRDLEKSKEFLIVHGNILLQENASNYLLLASLEDEMNGFHDKMRLTARQSQLVSSIAELAKSLKSHPGNVILPFFKRLEEKEHLAGFLDGVEVFVKRIQSRAVVKRKEMDEERRLEATNAVESGDAVDLADVPKEERLGPGGLDPVEVFESLPTSMQEAFESRETDKLQEALMKLTPEEAERHMKRCVDSGLWNA